MSDGFFVAACAVVALLDAQCGQLFACPKELVINWKNCSIGKIPTYIINLVCTGNWHVNAVTPPSWWNMSCWLSSSPSSKFTSLTKKKFKKEEKSQPEEIFPLCASLHNWMRVLRLEFYSMSSWILSRHSCADIDLFVLSCYILILVFFCKFTATFFIIFTKIMKTNVGFLPKNLWI